MITYFCIFFFTSFVYWNTLRKSDIWRFKTFKNDLFKHIIIHNCYLIKNENRKLEEVVLFRISWSILAVVFAILNSFRNNSDFHMIPKRSAIRKMFEYNTGKTLRNANISMFIPLRIWFFWQDQCFVLLQSSHIHQSYTRHGGLLFLLQEWCISGTVRLCLACESCRL